MGLRQLFSPLTFINSRMMVGECWVQLVVASIALHQLDLHLLQN